MGRSPLLDEGELSSKALSNVCEIIQKRGGNKQPCFTKQTTATNFPALHQLHGLIHGKVGVVRGVARGGVREVVGREVRGGVRGGG